MTEERFALYNQAKAELGASVDEETTTLVLTERSSTLDDALGHVDSEATPPVVVALVLDDGEHWEAVRVTGWDSDNGEATVDRGAWDSEARAWDSGTPVELRAVAAVYEQAFDRIGDLEGSVEALEGKDTLLASNNLSDLDDAEQARQNLELDGALKASNNLSDLADAEQARQNLEVDGALKASSNLSDLDDAEQARQNLEVSHKDHVLPLERGDHIGESAIDSQLTRPEDEDGEPQGARGKESIILGNRSSVPSDANGAIVIGNDVRVEGGEESVVIAGNLDEVSVKPGKQSLVVNCRGDVDTSESVVLCSYGKVDGGGWGANFCFLNWGEVIGRQNISFVNQGKVDGQTNVCFFTWDDVEGDYNVALHCWRDVVGVYNVLAQTWDDVEGDYNVALHSWRDVVGSDNVAIQNQGEVLGDYNIAIGGQALGPDNEKVNNTVSLGSKGTNPAKAKGDDAIAIGGEAEAESNSIAIGSVSSAKTGTNQVAGFPLAAHKGDEETFWDRSGQKGVLRAVKDTVDDASGASVAIPVPDGTVLFVDTVSLVVRSTDSPDGNVNVHVHADGTDLVNEDRAAGDWSEWHRHRWDADSLDGIPGGTDLEVEVGSTDSGSAEVEVILEGILVNK